VAKLPDPAFWRESLWTPTTRLDNTYKMLTALAGSAGTLPTRHRWNEAAAARDLTSA